MKLFLSLSLFLLLAGSAFAQRGGGGGGGMGAARGGMGGRGAGAVSGGARGGFYGARPGGNFGFGGFRNTGSGLGSSPWGGSNALFRGGYHDGYGSRFSNYGGYFLPYGAFGWGLGYFPGSDYDYGIPYSYDPSPNVTVIYPAPPMQPETTTIYVERAHPVIREYDASGQERKPAGEPGASSPIYLFAFLDHSIQAAIAYRVDGKTLRYVNLQHEEKQVNLDSVDRDFTLRLNDERRITVQLPQ